MDQQKKIENLQAVGYFFLAENLSVGVQKDSP